MPLHFQPHPSLAPPLSAQPPPPSALQPPPPPPSNLQHLTDPLLSPKYFSTIASSSPASYLDPFLYARQTSSMTAISNNKVTLLADQLFGSLLSPSAAAAASKESFLNSALLSSAKEDEVTSSEESQSVEMPARTAHFQKEAVFEYAAKLLFKMFQWTKSIPSFIQLPPADRTILLQESWADLFVLTSAQWGLIDSSEYRLKGTRCTPVGIN